MNTIPILISGKKRSGKDTLSNIISEKLKTLKILNDTKVYRGSLSHKPKTMVSTAMQPISDYLTEKYGVAKAEKDNWFDGDKTDFTRLCLQHILTDLFQSDEIDDLFEMVFGKSVGTAIWAEYLRNKMLVESGIWIISDVRQLHDINTMKKSFSPYIIRVNRKSDSEGFTGSTHITEIELDDYDGFDFVVENNGTLEDLESIADEIINKILVKYGYIPLDQKSTLEAVEGTETH